MRYSTLLHRTTRSLVRRVCQDRGQALAEFAVVLPVLMLIIVGILTFGRYENYANQETQLASEGGRWASVNVNPSTSQTLQAYIQSQTTGELLNGSSDVTSAVQVFIYYPTGSSNTVGSSVRVCVTATVRLLPMLGSVSSATIAEVATMRIEQAATNWSTSNNPSSMPSACPTTA
jgi:Flp pilus assembly protein TadG